MPGALKRLLRLRALEEEQRRAELAAGMARLRRIDDGSAAAWGEALASRERWFAGIAAVAGEPASPQPEAPSILFEVGQQTERIAQELAWELAMRNRGRAEAERPAQAAEVERERVGFLSGRRDRQQIEMLVEAEAADERQRRERLEQRGLDDWFQARRRVEASDRRTGWAREEAQYGTGAEETDRTADREAGLPVNQNQRNQNLTQNP